MIQGFSNRATYTVYEFLANKPDVYEQMVKAVKNSPAKAPEEMRSFVESYLQMFKPLLAADSLIGDLLDAAFQDVRFSEIRQQLQQENR